MRKFIVRILLFLAIMFVIDRLVGSVLNYASSHPKGGMTYRRNYISDYCKEDVLVFGSSRAHYHYNPQIIADSLGLSCFNCGEDAMGIVLYYAWWKLISHRYHPKMVIYEVTPQYDIRKSENNLFLWRLRRYYNREGIEEIFDKVDSSEQWKMLSWMYRYNSCFAELAADVINPLKMGGDEGFVGVNRIMKSVPAKGKPWYKGKKVTRDSLKMEYFEKMINEMGPTQLVFVVSPYFFGANDSVFEPIREISRKYDIPFLDYSNDPTFLRKKECFFDKSHLNAHGADLFTRELVCDIKARKKQKDNVSTK